MHRDHNLFMIMIGAYFLPLIKNDILTERRAKIRDIANTAYGIIDANYKSLRTGLSPKKKQDSLA